VSGDLPAVARAGMTGARSGGAWGSALTAAEFAAIRSVGFEPVGQVLGVAVYAAGEARGYSCPGARGSAGGRMPAGPATQVPGGATGGPSGRWCRPCTRPGMRPWTG
jgi:hypothetical protein